MRSDKQYHKIFVVRPDWLYLLLEREPPEGGASYQSIATKEIEGVADGVAVPKDERLPLLIAEFQEYPLPDIYERTAMKMALLQRDHGSRPVEGVIFFGSAELDPQTEPWRRVIRSVVLRDAVAAFAARYAEHPLTAVFQPLLADREQDVEVQALRDYRQIKYSKELTDEDKTVLLEVFQSWLVQRLKRKSRKEIEQMLIRELPSLEETRAGKELIELGEGRGEARGKAAGKAEGKAEALLVLLRNRFRRIPVAVQKQVAALEEKPATALLAAWDSITTLDELKARLAKHG